MNIVASPQAEAFIQGHGGRVYVSTEASRCCGGSLTFLSTEGSPKDGRSYERLDAGAFELWFSAGHALPDELRLELRGRRRPHIEAYWDGCVFVP